MDGFNLLNNSIEYLKELRDITDYTKSTAKDNDNYNEFVLLSSKLLNIEKSIDFLQEVQKRGFEIK